MVWPTPVVPSAILQSMVTENLSLAPRQSVCSVATQPSASSSRRLTVAVDGVPANERGSALATYTGFFDIATAIVGPTLGLIVVGVGYRAAFLTGAVTAGFALVVLHVVVAPRWNRAHPDGTARPSS